ncbi:uncharacterized protein BYT42DRAFT_616210 [Radiomyces spectabilis]|uniref:uncharacterized protein n=1 Tax=Radiomyces spectabilis TaxID=64574 RepID=UPI00221EA6B8|nr:uncharacterized protein BYT42DRAFT_616210 [Radiomyces spectabilis]KAI8373020.1 hypothetical protein BYT42DRAFT_616210 [Radiomyces spectabilis]
MTLLTLESWLEIAQRPNELAANETGDKVVSGALFIGEDTTDPDAHGAKLFERPKNHPVAVSSIIQYSSNATEFHPSSQSLKEAANSYDDFIKKVSSFPGFRFTSSHHDEIRHNGNIQTLLKEVNKVYLRGHDKEQKDATNKILSGLLSHEHSGERSYTISHLTIENLGTNADLKIYILAINQDVDHDDNGMITLTEDRAGLTVSEFTVNRGFLVSNADKLGEKISRAEIKDVVKDLTTPHCVVLS